jgi:hypothetical protein
VTTDAITQELIDEYGEERIKRGVEEMLYMFMELKNINKIIIDGVYYNPANVVCVQHFDHEWLKDKWPDLEWWDNDE